MIDSSWFLLVVNLDGKEFLVIFSHLIFNMSNSKISFDSLCAKSVQSDSAKVHTLAIHPNTSFEFNAIEDAIDIFSGKESGYVYSRYANPTTMAVADKIAKMEAFSWDQEIKAYLCASGMSAIHTLMLSLCQKNDRILLSIDLYGGTIELFDKVFRSVGIEYDWVDLKDPNRLEKQLKEKAYKALFFETPTNPLLHCYPIGEICQLCTQHGVKTILDNTFSTAYLQRAFPLGIDFVIYSATKYLAGHGNCTAGVVLGKDLAFMSDRFWQTLKLTGGICSPFEAWNLNNGIKTLTLRLDRHCENAMQLAQFLDKHPKIRTVNYPGLPNDPSHSVAAQQMTQFGGMLSFELEAELEEVLCFINRLQLITHAPTLGDVDSLLLHPYTSSHINVDEEICKKSGITPQLIRISVGIEKAKDLMADLERALG